MSVNAATSVSNFMALYVESQGRTAAALTPAEAAALQVALGQFQLGSTQLAEIGKLLDALQVMRGMMVTGTLPYTALDSIELSIQMLLQAAVMPPAPATVAASPAPPLPSDVQAFSDEYLTSSYLQDAAVWPGADTGLQADLATFDLAPREVAVATQYLYDVADQRRYLAAIDAALQAPDGSLYATASEPDYPTYLNYVQARADTAARIDAAVATVQGILAGTVNVWEASVDPVPWSLQQTDPQAAVPPSDAMDQARFELAEDKLLLGQLATQGRAVEGQMAQLTALLAAKTLPPLAPEQIFQYTTQLSDLKRQFRLISAEMAALQARVAHNTGVLAGTSTTPQSGLKADLDVTAAQGKLAAFAPTPINTGPSDPVPTSTLQAQWSADQATYAALVKAPPPTPPALPAPTLQLIEGYLGTLSYLLEVPVGMTLTDEQTDELRLLWAHRRVLQTQYQAVKAELDALKARMDYAQAVLDGWKPYQTSEWNRLNEAVAQATLRREAGETLPPTAGALATPPPQTVAWKLSGADPAHMQVSRIENFLLTALENDTVYQRLEEFAGYVGAVAADTNAATSARTTLQATISSISTSTSSGQAQKTRAQTQLTKLDSVMAWLDVYAPDAQNAYDNAESARTVTDLLQVDTLLAAVAASTTEVLYDDQALAYLKLDLANSNAAYYANMPDAASHVARTQYAQALAQLAANAYSVKLYTYKVATAPDEASQQTYQNSLDEAQAAHDALLEATLARYFDYAYAEQASATTWPRTVSNAMTDAQKADEVTSHYGGYLYTLIDPIPTTNLG